MEQIEQPQCIEQLISIMSDIRDSLSKESRHEREYWTVEDIAQYLDVSTKTLYNDYIVAPGFPQATRFPTKKDGSGQSRKYYRRKEIMAYLSRF